MINKLLEWLTSTTHNVARGTYTKIDNAIPDVPGEVAGLCGQAAELRQHVAVLMDWLPIPQLVFAVGLVFLGWSVGMVIRLARIAASFATFGGGSAA